MTDNYDLEIEATAFLDEGYEQEEVLRIMLESYGDAHAVRHALASVVGAGITNRNGY